MNKRLIFLIATLVILTSILGVSSYSLASVSADFQIQIGNTILIDVNGGEGYSPQGYGWGVGYKYVLEAILKNLWVVFTAIAVIFFVIAGVMFLTAQGNPDQLSKARSAFLWGAIGVVVAIMAYSIISIVSSFLN